jgi:hypothetical protein
MFSIICVFASLLSCASVKDTTTPRPTLDLASYSGTYTFNFFDTDEDATVDVQFHKNNDPYRIVDWLADGRMRDVIRNRTVTFTGAFVSVGTDGELIVDAEFVRFKVTDRRLQWLSGYGHDLFKDGIEHPRTKNNS